MFENKFVKKSSRYHKFILTRTNNRLKEVKQILLNVSDDVRDAYGEDSHEFAKVDSLSNDVDDTIDLFNGSSISESRNKFVNESEEETEWFDKMGDIKRHFPKDCILDCSSGGRVDDSVEYWVSELNFKVPVDRGLSYVREYGLDDIGPEDVDKYVLWIMCGNIREEAYEFCRDGSEWDYVDRESYPDEMDNWNDEDWDRFQEEACVCHLGM